MSQMLIDDFWVKMTELYDYSWTSRYGSIPSELWITILEGFNEIDLRRGMRKLIESGEFVQFPPKPLQFYNLCRPQPEPEKYISRKVMNIDEWKKQKESIKSNIKKLKEEFPSIFREDNHA